MATTFIKGKGQKKIKVESVFAAVKSVIAVGDEKSFLKLCRDKDLKISANVELINLLKEHLDGAEQKPATKMSALLASDMATASASHARVARRIRECDDTEDC